jgi:hypothetical protein
VGAVNRKVFVFRGGRCLALSPLRSAHHSGGRLETVPMRKERAAFRRSNPCRPSSDVYSPRVMLPRTSEKKRGRANITRSLIQNPSSAFASWNGFVVTSDVLQLLEVQFKENK